MQPFLLTSTMSLVDDLAAERDYGEALVEAWALVLFGIAVRASSAT
jgi:hypothetical protein